MGEEWLQANTASASNFMREEQARTKGGQEGLGDLSFGRHHAYPQAAAMFGHQATAWNPDPVPSGSSDLVLTEEEFQDLVNRLPALRTMKESLLMRMSYMALLQLNDALAKETKVSKKREDVSKLTHNRNELLLHPLEVAAGVDDRINKIHPARLMGGVACSAQTLWLKAREILGEEGVVPLGCYDMEAIGYSGSVTPKGWLAIHNPASEEMSLKLFHLSNVAGSGVGTKKLSLLDGEMAINVGDSLKEVTDMEDFKAALATATEAMAWACPWNKSVAALQGFLRTTNFCSKDLANIPKRVALLMDFTDHVFQRNALNWHNFQGFLTADELSNVWTTWVLRRPASFLGHGSGQGSSGQGGHGHQGRKDHGHKKEAKQQPKKDKGAKSDLCRRYNSPAGCPNAAGDCKTFYGFKLRHACSATTANGSVCGMSHPKDQHRKTATKPLKIACE